MSEESGAPQSPPTTRIIWVIALSAAVVVLGGLLYPAVFEREDTVSSIEQETTMLVAALDQYRREFGSYPGGGSRQVSKALHGENEKQKAFVEFRGTKLSRHGEVLDPWGTPYQFYFSGDQSLIRSAGENRKFEDSASDDFDDFIRG